MPAGTFIGTRGQGKRIEGVSFRLSGPEMNTHDICYYAHLEGYGDTQVHRNGQFCGTRGMARRLEGFALWLEPKQMYPTPFPGLQPYPQPFPGQQPYPQPFPGQQMTINVPSQCFIRHNDRYLKRSQNHVNIELSPNGRDSNWGFFNLEYVSPNNYFIRHSTPSFFEILCKLFCFVLFCFVLFF